MCVTVFISGEWCDSAGEVSKSLGIAVDDIPTLSGDPLRSDLCLCDADLDVLAARHNMAIEWEDSTACRLMSAQQRVSERRYIQPTRLDHPDVGSLAAARLGKSVVVRELRDLRQRLKDTPVGGKNAIRMHIVRAERAVAAYREKERRALESLELYANSLGRTTIRKRQPTQPQEPK